MHQHVHHSLNVRSLTANEQRNKYQAVSLFITFTVIEQAQVIAACCGTVARTSNATVTHCNVVYHCRFYETHAILQDSSK